MVILNIFISSLPIQSYLLYIFSFSFDSFYLHFFCYLTHYFARLLCGFQGKKQKKRDWSKKKIILCAKRWKTLGKIGNFSFKILSLVDWNVKISFLPTHFSLAVYWQCITIFFTSNHSYPLTHSFRFVQFELLWFSNRIFNDSEHKKSNEIVDSLAKQS